MGETPRFSTMVRSMIDDVYNKQILALALDIPRIGRLAAPQATATRHSKLCGSKITVDLVLDGDRVVGFIHGNFDPEAQQEEFRAALWRINVDAEAQGKGVGTFAVQALIEEARSRGVDRLTVLWERGEDGPEEFFLHVGFTPIGETPYGEVIGAIEL